MFRVTREFHFCYGHRLLNYEGKCRYLHGHNGKAVITLEAPGLDKLGMVNEGVKRQHIHKARRLHDVVLYGLLRDEWSRR